MNFTTIPKLRFFTFLNVVLNFNGLLCGLLSDGTTFVRFGVGGDSVNVLQSPIVLVTVTISLEFPPSRSGPVPWKWCIVFSLALDLSTFDMVRWPYIKLCLSPLNSNMWNGTVVTYIYFWLRISYFTQQVLILVSPLIFGQQSKGPVPRKVCQGLSFRTEVRLLTYKVRCKDLPGLTL